jgi:hypothetical protein
MENKTLAVTIVILAAFLLAAQQSTVSARQLTVCQDYNFKVNVNTAPVTVDFYIGEELFKTVPSTTPEISTLLHCNHEYRVVYKATGYETYEEEYNVKKSMPIDPETRNIVLEKVGGAN